MKLRILHLITVTVLCFNIPYVQGQSFTNGNFTSAGSGWGCNPETNPVSVYGGSGSNRVAEVDISANLCQTISGFIVGDNYQFTFQCSRRTTCGPTLQSMNLTISNGALSTSVSRNGGGFNFTTETFTFTATSTSHTFSFSGTSAGTCGLIIDDLQLTAISLPVELISFEVIERDNQSAHVFWQTASELNNSHFLLERRTQQTDWIEVAQIEGHGTTNTVKDYSYIDRLPQRGTFYYRLTQLDFDGTSTPSPIVKLTANKLERIAPYPNPCHGQVKLLIDEELTDVRITDVLSSDKTDLVVPSISGGAMTLDFSSLPPGFYFIHLPSTTYKIRKI